MTVRRRRNESEYDMLITILKHLNFQKYLASLSLLRRRSLGSSRNIGGVLRDEPKERLRRRLSFTLLRLLVGG